MTQVSIHTGTLDIGTDRALALAGYGRRDVATGSAGAGLEANWVHCRAPGAGGDVLFLALDTLFSSEVFETALAAALAAGGLGDTRICAMASHTHYAPSLDPAKPDVGPADPAYVTEIAGRIAGDILARRESDPARIPARWAFAREEVAGSVYRRARRLRLSVRGWPWLGISMQIAPNPGRTIDRDLRLWRAEDAAGQVLFAIASWPCHATSRAAWGQASPDFIAALRDGIRACHPDCPVLFLPGASGDIRSHFTHVRHWRNRLYPYPFQTRFAPPAERDSAVFDAHLRSAAERCAAQAEARAEIEWPIADVAHADLGIAHAEILEGAAPAREMGLQKAVLGGLSIYGIGAEVSSEWPAVLGLDADPARTILSGCIGPVSAYLPTDRQIPEGGYEVDAFRRAFRLEGRYSAGKKLAPVLSRAMARLDETAES